MAKFDLPIRYYLAPMLARRWECHKDDINHLIEINLLSTVPMLAAYAGPEYTRLAMITFPDEETYRREINRLGEEYMDSIVIPAVPENDETQEQARERMYRWVHENGYDRRVISIHEVKRFEALMTDSLQDEPVETPTAPRSKHLPTNEMAKAFNGLAGFNFQQWKNKLSDPPDWIKTAKVFGGGPPNPNWWDPVKLATALMFKGKVDLKDLNNRFKTDQRLQPWMNDWQSYAERIEDS